MQFVALSHRPPPIPIEVTVLAFSLPCPLPAAHVPSQCRPHFGAKVNRLMYRGFGGRRHRSEDLQPELPDAERQAVGFGQEPGGARRAPGVLRDMVGGAPCKRGDEGPLQQAPRPAGIWAPFPTPGNVFFSHSLPHSMQYISMHAHITRARSPSARACSEPLTTWGARVVWSRSKANGRQNSF
jgi:hypothetical protein